MMWNLNDPGLESNLNKTLPELDSNLATLLSAPQNTPRVSTAPGRIQTDRKLSRFVFGPYKGGLYSPFVIATTTESMLKAMDDITIQ
mgnify:CR=1 FL=1